MKKMANIGAFLLIAILAVQAASAISTNMKSDYEPKETMIVQVYGNILEPITYQNIIFKRGHVAISLDYGLEKLGEKYFIWAIAPESENNYTMAIEDVSTSVSGQPQKIDFEQNFSVIGNMASYTIKPGAVYTTKDFDITVQLNEDMEKIIKVNFPYERDVVLKPGINSIKISTAGVNETSLINISVGDYILPAYIIANATPARTINITGASEIENETVANETPAPQNLTPLPNTTIERIIEGPEETQEKYYCIQLKGELCGSDESCTGANSKKIDTLDSSGTCCVNGQCSKEAEGGSSWIGYLIVSIVIIAAVFVWLKYKKAAPGKTSIEKAIAKK